VNLLLQYGADPTIENALGKSPLDYCDSFPELKGALSRLIIRRQNKDTKVTSLFRRNSTANETETKKIPCDKPIAGGILEKLIDAKIRHLFETVKDFVSARFLHVFRHWCMRGLKEDQESTNSLTEFKRELRWRDDKLWFDVGGIGLIIYCVIRNEINVVRELLQCLRQDFTGEKYTARLESRIPDKVYVGVGIVGGLTAL